MTSTLLPPGPTGVGDVFGPALAAAREQLGDLVEVQTWSLDDTRLAERFAQVAALRASADELMARMAGEMDDRGLANGTAPPPPGLI